MDQTASMVIYGKQPVREALLSGHKVNRLIIAHEMQTKEKQFFLKKAEKQGIPVDFRPKGELQRYCGPVLHQGMTAFMEPYNYIDEDRLWQLIGKNTQPLLLILDQIQDPQNLGAILRTAEIVGVDAVILPDKGSAAINATVAKTSAGAVFHLSVHRTKDLFFLLEKVRENHISLVALAPGAPDTIYRFEFTRPVALIVGSEGRGVRKNLQIFTDITLSIPQKGKTGSLNASNSAAIALYEILRQRSFDPNPE
jgi:23S rRNA (guanosine2251-2'-O)-methyltransferase